MLKPSFRSILHTIGEGRSLSCSDAETYNQHSQRPTAGLSQIIFLSLDILPTCKRDTTSLNPYSLSSTPSNTCFQNEAVIHFHRPYDFGGYADTFSGRAANQRPPGSEKAPRPLRYWRESRRFARLLCMWLHFRRESFSHRSLQMLTVDLSSYRNNV